VDEHGIQNDEEDGFRGTSGCIQNPVTVLFEFLNVAFCDVLILMVGLRLPVTDKEGTK